MREDALDQARTMLEDIRPHLEDVIPLSECLSSWDGMIDELKEKLDNTKFLAAHQRMINSVASSLLLGTCRIWDSSKGTNSLRNLSNLLSNAEVTAHISGDRYEDERRKATDEFINTVNEFVCSESNHALLVSRNEGFAHNVNVARSRKKMQDPRPANFGELHQAVALAIKCFDNADLALNSNSNGYSFLEEEYKELFAQIFGDIPNYKNIKK